MRRLVDEDLRGRENKVKKKTKEMNISYNEIRSSLQSLER